MKKCVNGKGHEFSAEHLVRRKYGMDGWYGGTKHYLSIEFVGSFERYNTRPYHNHESWGFGWIVSNSEGQADSECLECALEELFAR